MSATSKEQIGHPKNPIALGSLTEEQLHEELNRGISDFENGNYITSEELSNKLKDLFQSG